MKLIKTSLVIPARPLEKVNMSGITPFLPGDFAWNGDHFISVFALPLVAKFGDKNVYGNFKGC